MKSGATISRVGKVILIGTAFCLITPAVVLAAGDPIDNFLTNAAVALQRWGTKVGIIYLIGSFAAVGWASKENNPDMRASGWRHVLGAVITLVGCNLAPTISDMITSWAK